MSPWERVPGDPLSVANGATFNTVNISCVSLEGTGKLGDAIAKLLSDTSFSALFEFELVKKVFLTLLSGVVISYVTWNLSTLVPHESLLRSYDTNSLHVGLACTNK